MPFFTWKSREMCAEMSVYETESLNEKEALYQDVFSCLWPQMSPNTASSSPDTAEGQPRPLQGPVLSEGGLFLAP